MTDNGSNFVIAQMQPVYHTRVHDHFPARHCPRVQIIAADNVHLPTERHSRAVFPFRIRLQTVEHRRNPPRRPRRGIQYLFALRLTQNLQIAFSRTFIQCFGIVTDHVGDRSTARRDGNDSNQ